MSILLHSELVKLVQRGVITNVEPDQINGASIDLTLGNVFYVEDLARPRPIDLAAKESVPMHRFTVEPGGKLTLAPGQFCLAQTEQVFNLPEDIAAYFKLKSTLGRSGLGHALAGFADPTWNGSVLTLEYKNDLEVHPLVLTPGMKCGQMIFLRGEGEIPPERCYATVGQYNTDATAQPAKQLR